jgi:hypothetical protein
VAITKAYITTIASEFANTDEARILALADIVSLRINGDIWQGKADYATALLVMHYLKLDRQGGNGPIVRDQMGNVSTDFKAPSFSEGEDSLDSTVYGSEFKTLAKTILRGPLVT